MRADLRRLLFTAFALLLIAAPAAAELFTITLTNGQMFETRYRPQQASFDPELVMLMTMSGNWIAVPRSDIDRVDAETETRGFGRVINTTTIDLGIAPNDTPVPGQGGGTELDALRALLDQQAPPQSFDQPQFVSPRQAGSGGLPVTYATGGAFGGGGGVSVVVPPPAPTPPPQ